jgi:hypothetical protein
VPWGGAGGGGGGGRGGGVGGGVGVGVEVEVEVDGEAVDVVSFPHPRTPDTTTAATAQIRFIASSYTPCA